MPPVVDFFYLWGVLKAALPHLVSGAILAIVSYIAARVRSIFHRYKELPNRLDAAEAQIAKHEARIYRLEVPAERW